MMSALRTILLWLAFTLACFLPASAQPPATENRVWEIFSIGYDAPTAEVTDLGIRTETSTSDYDSTPIHGANIEEIPTEANRTLFGQNAEFNAAEEATAGKAFTQAQKRDILNANRAKNGGTLRSDLSGDELVPAQKSQSGVTPPTNEAQVDHIYPRSKGGQNTVDNAQVLSRQENRQKSDTVP